MIELKKGWILQNYEENFLDKNFCWVLQDRKEAFIHEGGEERLVEILREIGNEVQVIYPAMVFNGHLLFGQPLYRISAQKMSWN